MLHARACTERCFEFEDLRPARPLAAPHDIGNCLHFFLAERETIMRNIHMERAYHCKTPFVTPGRRVTLSSLTIVLRYALALARATQHDTVRRIEGRTRPGYSG